MSSCLISFDITFIASLQCHCQLPSPVSLKSMLLIFPLSSLLIIGISDAETAVHLYPICSKWSNTRKTTLGLEPRGCFSELDVSFFFSSLLRAAHPLLCAGN